MLKHHKWLYFYSLSSNHYSLFFQLLFIARPQFLMWYITHVNSKHKTSTVPRGKRKRTLFVPKQQKSNYSNNWSKQTLRQNVIQLSKRTLACMYVCVHIEHLHPGVSVALHLYPKFHNDVNTSFSSSQFSSLCASSSQAYILLDCGDDNVCIPDLQLSAAM